MFVREIRKFIIREGLSNALRVLLVAGGGTLAAGLSPLTIHAEPPQVASPGPNSTCRAVLDANDKLFTLPFHMYMMQTSAGGVDGKPVAVATETVSAGGVEYILMNGKWSPSPVSNKELRALEQQNRKTAKMTCHYVRDEPVNGEMAALYSAHGESAHGRNDDQIWIAKSTGLIVRQETDMDTGRPNGKAHLTVRYEYKNVRAPKL